ncbi:hypothetical protein BSL78_27913 [Apostichopus japonicus]|uniref:Uncharacterized protein n=1 Tax=Stichopus japonicus TaxID=307972 RepID=A0A2G8JHN3_STIJA|nr:hypothetical protein BSL78_27913 [Apostichopus japonicus]
MQPFIPHLASYIEGLLETSPEVDADLDPGLDSTLHPASDDTVAANTWLFLSLLVPSYLMPSYVSHRRRTRGRVTREPVGLRGNHIQEEANLDLTQRLENAVEKAIHGMSSELLKLKKNFERELKLHSEEINKLKSENSKLCADLGNRVTSLESSLDLHSSLLNKNERFLRKNNLRIVGYKTQPSEDCLEITKEVLKKVGIQEAKLERAHRDGKAVQGRSRHILVKLSFFQDKLFAMKYAREKLKGSDYFITDDLTLTDLKEKRRWAKEVSDLYKSGTKLRFQRGMWRRRTAKLILSLPHR